MTKTELKDKWQEVLNKLNGPLNSLIISTFFEPLKPCKINDKEQKIILLDESGTGIMRTSALKYMEKVLPVVESVFGAPYTLDIVDREPGEEETDELIDLFQKEDALNPEYTFETFVNGPNNKLAFAASLAVSESFSKKYNPLFIYGGSGLGKTHLMHAIGHYVLRNRPKKKVLYVSAETFVSEFVEAVRTKTQQQFKDKYRKVDYLLFDDVQFIAGKSSAVEEELFNTFEALDNSNKQIVFTSDRPPKELGELPDRLVARFAQGIPIDIQAPEYETRMAILKNKAILEGLNVDDENLIASLDIIAQSIEGNIRELTGAFNRVKFSVLHEGGSFSVQRTKKILTDIFNVKEKEISPALIKKIVAKYYNVKVSDLESPKRSQNITYPRQIAIYLIRQNCPTYSFPKIGEEFGGRDHTTIMHSYEKIESDLGIIPDLKSVITHLQELIDE
ncbi:MAG: chromosomal replication initiator protein DnaA [Clostridia bacterium]|nr:chromosomal replication initiator protein DnaA [Clostridia bacterium]